MARYKSLCLTKTRRPQLPVPPYLKMSEANSGNSAKSEVSDGEAKKDRPPSPQQEVTSRPRRRESHGEFRKRFLAKLEVPIGYDSWEEVFEDYPLTFDGVGDGLLDRNPEDGELIRPPDVVDQIRAQAGLPPKRRRSGDEGSSK